MKKMGILLIILTSIILTGCTLEKQEMFPGALEATG